MMKKVFKRIKRFGLSIVNVDFRIRFLVLFILLCLSILYSYDRFHLLTNIPEIEIKALDLEQNNEANGFISTVEVFAENVFVYDITDNKILFEKNSNNVTPIASITKLFSSFVLLKYLSEDDVSVIEINDSNINSSRKIVRGERFNALDLLSFSLIVSSNSGFDAISKTVSRKTGKSFFEISKEVLSEFGLNQTFLLNPTGLDFNENLAGAKSSAQDVATLAKLFVEMYAAISYETAKEKESFVSLNGNEFVGKNTNASIVSKEKVLLSKTGYTRIAGGNLVVVLEIEDHEIVIVALGSPSRVSRINDVDKLIQKTREYILLKEEPLVEVEEETNLLQ